MSSIKKKYISPKLKEWKKIINTFQSIDINLYQNIQPQPKKKLLSLKK
ncbi:MAG: hypothetical protein ACRC80_28165 [Waterburya sp.]